MNWFEVSKNGLAKLLIKKGPAFAVLELLQNAWDEASTEVDVRLERVSNSPFVTLTVTDNNPTGFSDLAHAFTLFAESAKKSDETKRGRFNLGEKLVLALCSEAVIESTTGSVIFDDGGRRTSRKKRDAGSMFQGKLRMTNTEIEICRATVFTCLPPAHVKTVFNGETVPVRLPLAQLEVALPTEKANDEGYLTKTTRKTVINIHELLDGEVASLFELGIPVVATGDRYHIDVAQKVPLNFDRDNVTPAYLAKVRACVLEHMAARLDTDDANATWVRDAIEHHGEDLSAKTVEQVIGLRFGAKRVIYDPSDREANNIAVVEGYTVIHGSQLSKPEWAAVRRTEAALPAGQVCPSRPLETEGAVVIPENKWTDTMRAVAAYAKRLAKVARAIDIRVAFIANPKADEMASYGNRCMNFNVPRLGARWFEPTNRLAITDLIIHELGHEVEGNHLSAGYYRALTNIGAKVVEAALTNPTLFELGARGEGGGAQTAPRKTMDMAAQGAEPKT